MTDYPPRETRAQTAARHMARLDLAPAADDPAIAQRKRDEAADYLRRHDAYYGIPPLGYTVGNDDGEGEGP